MPDDENNIRILESQIPKRSRYAFRKARRKVLASGQSVVHSEGGVIYRVAPDGTRTTLKKILPPIPVAKGAKFRLG